MKPRTRVAWLVGAGAALVAAAVVSYSAALSVVRGAVATALGPRGEVGTIEVGLGGLRLSRIRVPGPSGWPAEETLRAERVSVAPSVLTLFSGDVLRIRKIALVAPYLSVRRTREGRLEALPGLMEGAAAQPSDAPPASGATRLAIRKLEIESGVLELFDASVAQPPQKTRLEQIEASVHDLSAPTLEGRTAFELAAVVKGRARDGRARLSGWADVAARDSDVSIELRGVDLAPLQAYLLKPGEASVKRGSLDLDLRAEVTGGKLEARGRITLDALELASTGGITGQFLGVPHQVVLAAMKDRGGRLALDFTLSGNVDDPHFSLNEALGTQIAFSLAETLGLTVGGLVKDVGSLGVKGGEALGSAAKGVGGAILDLFEGEPKRK